MKKWSYATALMLSLAGGGMLTGCIDNDEPYGIKEVRLAMASFLDSQKALSEANAAAVSAKAEIDKINAEIAKIQAEQAKILAEAEAKIKEAQAAQEQAKADMEKEKVNAYIAQKEAELERYIGETQNAINWANLAYEKALYAWEQQKVKDANAYKTELYSAVAWQYETYLAALKRYNALNASLLEAQREYAQWANDLVYDEETGKYTLSPKYNFEKYYTDEVAGYEKDIVGIQNQIAEYTAFAEKLDNITKSELYATLEGYEAKYEANKLAIDEAVVKRAELAVEHMDKRKEWEAAQNKVAELKNQEIAIPAYKIPSYPNIPGFEMEKGTEIVPANPAVVFNLNDKEQVYYQYKDIYKTQITNIENALLDANDKAWTQARVNEMKRELVTASEEYNKAKDNWVLAKKAYNMGNVPDASVFPGEDAVETAIAAYAAAAESLSTKRADKDAKYEAKKEAEKAYIKAYNAYPDDPNSALAKWNAANLKHNEDLQAAWDAFYKAQNAANDAFNQACDDNQQAVNNAWDAYYRALRAADAAMNEWNLDQENKDLTKKKDDAQKLAADLNAKAEAAGAKLQENNEKAGLVRDKAIAKAKSTRVAAINAADEVFEKANTAFVAAGGNNEMKDPTVKAAYDAYEKARIAYEEAEEAFNKDAQPLRDAYNAIEEPIQKQKDMIIEQFDYYNWDSPSYNDASWKINSYIYGYINELPEIVAPAYDQDPQNVYFNVKNLLIDFSRRAYGWLTNYDYEHDLYEDFLSDEAFLVDEVTLEMVNDYIAGYIKHNDYTQEPYQYYQFYNENERFGAYGNVLYLENRIKIGEAYLANSDDVNAITKALEDNRAALEKSYDDQKALVEDAEKIVTEKEKAYASVFTEIDDTIGSLGELNRIYDNILAACKWAVADLANREDVPDNINISDDKSIKNAIEQTEGWITSLNEALAKKQESLELAKKQLETALNNGDLYNVNPYEIKVNDLKAELEAEKANLELHKAHLDELQAAYDAASSKNAKE